MWYLYIGLIPVVFMFLLGLAALAYYGAREAWAIIDENPFNLETSACVRWWNAKNNPIRLKFDGIIITDYGDMSFTFFMTFSIAIVVGLIWPIMLVIYAWKGLIYGLRSLRRMQKLVKKLQAEKE